MGGERCRSQIQQEGSCTAWPGAGSGPHSEERPQNQALYCSEVLLEEKLLSGTADIDKGTDLMPRKFHCPSRWWHRSDSVAQTVSLCLSLSDDEAGPS